MTKSCDHSPLKAGLGTVLVKISAKLFFVETLYRWMRLSSTSWRMKWCWVFMCLARLWATRLLASASTPIDGHHTTGQASSSRRMWTSLANSLLSVQPSQRNIISVTRAKCHTTLLFGLPTDNTTKRALFEAKTRSWRAIILVDHPGSIGIRKTKNFEIFRAVLHKR